MVKKLLSWGSALASIIAISFVTATPAQATAYGCTSWAAFSISSLPTPVPRGFLCHRVVGDGTRITHETVHWETVPGLCNNRVDFRYRDLSGVWYKTVSLGTKYNCNWSYDGAVSTDWTARRGIACAYLYSNGKYVARQCHSIS